MPLDAEGGEDGAEDEGRGSHHHAGMQAGEERGPVGDQGAEEGDAEDPSDLSCGVEWSPRRDRPARPVRLP